MFYYRVKFANESTVILSAGDPVDEVPVEFQGDVVNSKQSVRSHLTER